MNKEIDALLRSDNKEDIILGMRLVLETMEESEIIKYIDCDGNLFENYKYPLKEHGMFRVKVGDKYILAGTRYIQYTKDINDVWKTYEF